MTLLPPLLALFACGTAAEPTAVQVWDDLAKLREHLLLPDDLTEARWTAKPLGVVGWAPGPTDLALAAWLPLTDGQWEALRPSLGEPTAEGPCPVPSDLAAAVLPVGAAGLLSAEGLAGVCYPATAFETTFWRGGVAVRIAGGVVVTASSR